METSTIDPGPLLDLVLDQLGAVISYDAAAILGIDHDRFEPLKYRGPKIPEELASLRFDLSDNPVLQQLARTKEMIYIEDSGSWEAVERRFGGELSEWQKALTLERSWLAIPLIVSGNLTGGLVLAHKEPDRFSPAARLQARVFADRAAPAIENARLYGQAKDAAAKTERKRLARDLHDGLIQELYAIKLHIEASRMALAAGEVDVTFQNLDELQSMTQEAETALRELIFELRPPVLEEVGLAAALKNRLESVEERAGIRTELQVEGEIALHPEAETELFWVAQEALSNVLKHARATRVQIQLQGREGLVRLAIRDNGQGFDPHEMEASRGMGLRNMRERVQRIGGTMTVETSPGEGTLVNIERKNAQ